MRQTALYDYGMEDTPEWEGDEGRKTVRVSNMSYSDLERLNELLGKANKREDRKSKLKDYARRALNYASSVDISLGGGEEEDDAYGDPYAQQRLMQSRRNQQPTGYEEFDQPTPPYGRDRLPHFNLFQANKIHQPEPLPILRLQPSHIRIFSNPIRRHRNVGHVFRPIIYR